MSFTLRDIKGAVVEKEKCCIHDFSPPMKYVGGCNCFEVKVHNQAIDAQASVKLEWDREKLVEVLIKAHTIGIDSFMEIEENVEGLADAIINEDINKVLRVSRESKEMNRTCRRK